MKTYYFDTSIWLDFFENRNEPSMPKGEWAKKLVSNISENKDKIIFSDNNSIELEGIGYSKYEIEDLLSSLKPLIYYVESTAKQVENARDLSKKRDVPKRDALHALLARDNKAILVTLDNHFKKLTDIAYPCSPKSLI